MIRPSFYSVTVLLLVALIGCNQENDDIPGNGELTECIYEEHALEWTDAAEDDDRSYAELLAPYEGTHETSSDRGESTDKDASVLLTFEGDKRHTPVRYETTTGGCPDYVELPTRVVLTEGDAPLWNQSFQVTLFALDESRDLNASVHLKDPKDYEELERIQELPEINDNEEILAAVSDLTLQEAGGLQMEFRVSVEGHHGSGKDSAVSEHQAPWFTLHVFGNQLAD